jgi:hypothetical protein
MNWSWMDIKEQAQAAFTKAAQLFAFQMVCFYLLGCVVAHRPLGPTGYVSFTYHCFQWRGGKSTVKRVNAPGAASHE